MAETKKDTNHGSVVRFVPFASTVESSFWVRYCQEKLDTIKLSEEPIPITASYTVDGSSPRLQLQESSLQNSDWNKSHNEFMKMKGSLRGFNTTEGFQKADKNQVLRDWFTPQFLAGDLSSLTSFLVLTFADLKNHKVLYWFAIPALLPGDSIRSPKEQEWISKAWSEETCDTFSSNVDAMRRANLGSYDGCPPFFVSDRDRCLPLSSESYKEVASSGKDVFFGFFDPTTSSSAAGAGDANGQPMGWPLRNLIAYLSHHLELGGQQVDIVSCRPQRLRRIYPEKEGQGVPSLKNSILITVKVPEKESYAFGVDEKQYKAVGWELNARSKPGPRWVNLRPLLDDKLLAIQAADLNLKLMKWRMIPSLDVAMLQNTRVLIVGAGTLGCSVARVLLAWGIRDMTFVDNGKVSYSNPVRQNLFTLEDCRDEEGGGGGKPKAKAAAEALHAVAADVNSKSIHLSIPMPGHAETDIEKLTGTVEQLDNLVQECDVVYLLTDTRESRWLPTVMAAVYDKPLINAALGLDGWLVMRHGGSPSVTSDHVRLGCYFCNDVVAPDNSMKNRTLDQQCTVTRPGLAPVASSMAVELMVALLHHSQKEKAPAPKPNIGTFAPTTTGEDASSCALGVIPHQIRGSLVTYTMMTPTVPAFSCCTGCSPGVVDEYKKNKVEVVHQACKSLDGSYLEGISGLTAFREAEASKLVDMEDWDDDELSM